MKKTLCFVLGAMLMAMLPGSVNAQEVVAHDNHNVGYATLAAAFAAANADTIFVSADSVSITAPITIGRDVVVNQMGHKIECQVTNPIAISGASVKWNGGNGQLVSAVSNTKLFSVENGAVLNISNLNASAANIATIENGGQMTAGGASNFTITDNGIYAVIAKGTGNVTIDNVSFAGGNSGLSLNPDFEGTAQMLATTVAGMSAYTVPVNANAYAAAAGGYLAYYRTLKQASTVLPAASTIYLARDMALTENDTIVSGITLDMRALSTGSIFIGHTEGTVRLMGNGSMSNFSASEGNSAAIVLDTVTVSGNFVPESHKITVNYARINNIVPGASANITIHDGKYSQKYPAFLANRKSYENNTDSDADVFRYKVVDGYSVTWVNYDCHGNDTTIVYNTVDNKIDPVLPCPAIRPQYDDTLFYAWYVDSGSWQTPWAFLVDVLTSDTNLYARWEVIDRTTQTTYSVRHRQITLAGDTVTADSITYIGTIGGREVAYPVIYYGFHPTVDSIVVDPLLANDSLLTFIYTRDTFVITYNATPGLVIRGGINTDTYVVQGDSTVYGAPIDWTEFSAYYEGHTFTGWSGTNPATMPAESFTVNAQYTANTYPVTWVFGGTDSVTYYTTAYSGADFTGVLATYIDDTNAKLAANLTFIKGTDTLVGGQFPRAAGTWTVKAAPVNDAYTLAGNIATLVITPATLTVSGVVADTVKFYDGSDSSHVSNAGTLSGLIGSDVLSLVTTARFSGSAVGTGYDVITSYSLVGDARMNYFTPIADTITHNGVILEKILPDTVNHDGGIEVSATGYCSGSGAIHYYLASGSNSADQYKLTFDNPSFTNIPWTNRAATDNSIDITVPAGTPAGVYTATLVFRNSTYGVESNPIAITFKVNLPETYTMPLFSDVIALVDTCNCFTNIRWYHSTDGGTTWTEVVEARDKYYYQEIGGLTGEYYVSATMSGQNVFTCPQTDVTTLLADQQTPAVKVSAYPNPTSDQVTIRISNSSCNTHTLSVMSVMGLTVENRVFEGDETHVDLRGLHAGNYVVSVDGVVVRVIKK